MVKKPRLFIALCTLPALILTIVFMIVPMVNAIYLSFTSSTALSVGFNSKFVFLDNYKYMFQDKDFLQALFNTFKLMLVIPAVTIFLSLVFAFACIIGIMFPMMYRGISPIVLTIIVAVLTTIVTLGLLGGYSSKTVSAILGTAIGVVIAAVAAMAFGKAAGITGYKVSDIEALNYVGQNTKIKIGELLFAGIIISALGAVMDVGMSIASTIQEIYETDKTLSMKRLFVSGINVGRDMMGTMTNTLIFAYVGGAMTTLVINYAYDLSYRQLANSYVIGIEIKQGLSGSLGVVLTVPITALIASFLAVRKK